jgi:outer membrane protein assembly factor BamD (BamD/ComL family)
MPAKDPRVSQAFNHLRMTVGKRTIASALTVFVLFSLSLGFAYAQVANQKASVNHSDKMLFEQAQQALKKSDYVEARTLLESLINTHPDSAYVPLAKLSVADSWYSQRALKRAELEYRDFITFFPNRPEVAEAQRRINSIERSELVN